MFRGGGGLQWAGVSHRPTAQFFILSLLLFDREICGSWQVPRTFEQGYSFMSSGSRVLWRECKQKGQLTRLRAFKPPPPKMCGFFGYLRASDTSCKHTKRLIVIF